MLKPGDNRLNYSDLLTPPAGYEVEFAVGTTYSLDLEALVGVPLALSLSEEMNRTLKDDPVYVLEGLRRSADKFAIFCEAGQVKVPRDANSIFAMMENSVFEVSLENDMSFHPKIWLIKYRNEEDELLYRLLVLTRNMTFDRSWDIAIALEGTMDSEKTSKNLPLADFLHFLTQCSTDELKTKQIKTLMDELEFVHFNPVQKQIPAFDFCPLGIGDYGKDDTGLFESYHKLIIISPFISESIVRELNEKSLSHPEKVLITRKTELHKLSPDVFNGFVVYTLKDSVIDGETALSGETDEEAIAQLQDIHAKLYARSKYNEHHIYIGSANSSRNAFNGNVEFLLKLKYQKRGFRITNLLDDLFGDDEDDNPFERIEEIPDEDEADTNITDQLQKAIKQLCRVESEAYVTAEEDQYSVKITFDSIPDDNIQFTISPLLSTKSQPLQSITIFEQLSMLELGSFYTITAEKDDEQVERVIKINTSGIPEDRDGAIFRSIIDNSHKFLKYVAFLLADDFLMAALENSERQHSGFGNWEEDSGEDPVLYENMLTTAARSPEKLKDVENMIRIIRDEKIIPQEFDQLYQTFIQAAKKVKK
ncbi:phospholipase D family protein [Virgibacillus doumboii]|uniref:phospholipase D family protein n=1 Tax=Virgibacillus doumboii TaxID=2697503 RepID=UPI0013DFA968|nr:phospholipase D family protein [Virgibacillus doumboii]